MTAKRAVWCPPDSDYLKRYVKLHRKKILGVSLELNATETLDSRYTTWLMSEDTRLQRGFREGECQPVLWHRRLEPGESATGFITFEVPQTDRRFEFSFALYVGSHVETVAIRLPEIEAQP